MWEHVFTDLNSNMGGDNEAEVSISFDGPGDEARDVVFAVIVSQRPEDDPRPYWIEEIAYHHKGDDTEVVGDIAVVGDVRGYQTVADAYEDAKRIAEESILLELEFLNN